MHLIAQQREQRLALIEDSSEEVVAVAKQRNVYDAQHHQTLPGKRVRSESDPQSSDVAVNEAFDGSGVTHDVYEGVFDRQSIDGQGMPINSSVHYRKNFDNAMWNGSQMVYGDGDGKLFNPFTKPLEVIAHELTHGVTQYTAALTYSGQSGALNEHISDAFGIMVKQYALGQTAKLSNWLIGDGLLAPGVVGHPVELGPELGLLPVGVDLEAGDPVVDPRHQDRVLAAELEEQRLEPSALCAVEVAAEDGVGAGGIQQGGRRGSAKRRG